MPKMKTHKATAKRFKRTRRSYDKDHAVTKPDAKRVRQLLGLKKRS